jgi:hypothetical protein
LPAGTIAALRQKGMMFARFDTDVAVRPRWYQVAWHTEEYVRNHWGTIFQIAAYLPRGLQAYQDLVVAVRPGNSPSLAFSSQVAT